MPDARIHPANRSASKRFWWSLGTGLTPVLPETLEQEAYSPDPYSPDPYSAL